MANNVESCCLKFDWFQTLHCNCQATRNNMQQGVQMDATCNIPTMLGVVGQQCCVCLHRASWLSLSMRQEKRMYCTSRDVLTWSVQRCVDTNSYIRVSVKLWLNFCSQPHIFSSVNFVILSPPVFYWSNEAPTFGQISSQASWTKR